MKQRQVNGQIRIFVDNVHKHFVHIQRDIQFLLALPDERLLFCLAQLHLATHKFPQQPSGFMGRTLANHKLILISEQGCDYF